MKILLIVMLFLTFISCDKNKNKKKLYYDFGDSIEQTLNEISESYMTLDNKENFFLSMNGFSLDKEENHISFNYCLLCYQKNFIEKTNRFMG